MPAEQSLRVPDAMPAHDASIHAARALLMLYVVGYLHLGTYVGKGESHIGWLNAPITQLVLGCFTFISGYLLASRPLSLDLRSVITFYRRRLVRIYPLFVLALIGFVLLDLTHWSTAVKSALGLTMFMPDPPMTLWYAVMLLVCCAVAPLMLAGTPRTSLAVSLILLACLGNWHALVKTIDLRMVTQFGAFAAGVMIARTGQRFAPVSPLLIVAALAALALQFATARKPASLNAWLALPAMALLPLLLLRWIDTWPQSWVHHRGIEFLSHASFSAYLFHRIGFTLSERWLPIRDELIHWLWLVGGALPLVLVVSSFIQTAYDHLLIRSAKTAAP